MQELDQVGGIAAVRRRLTGQVDVDAGARLADTTRNGAVLALRHDAEPMVSTVARSPRALDHVVEIHADGEGPLAQLPTSCSCRMPLRCAADTTD